MKLDDFDIDSVIIGFKSVSKISQKNLLRFFCYHDLSRVYTKEKFIITSDLNRHSYVVLFENIKSLSERSSMTFTSKDLKFSLSLTAILRAITIFYCLNKDHRRGFIHTVAYLTYVIKTINTLVEVKTSTKVDMISFMPLHGVENIIAQYVKHHGGSVSMYQHALYKNDDSLNELDKIIFNVDNYKYVDKLLLWGEATFKELVKYLPESKLFIAGNPFLEPKLKREVQTGNVLILLTSDEYSVYNNRLIEYITNLPVAYNLFAKIHPNSNLSDKRVKILPKNISLTNAIIETKCEFAISVNSSSYYDMYRLGVRCFKYEVDEIRKLDSVLPFDSVYSDECDLEMNINSEPDINDKLDYFYSKKRQYK